MSDIKFSDFQFTGKVMYAKVHTPGTGFTPEATKEYTVDLVLTPETEKSLRSMLKTLKMPVEEYDIEKEKALAADPDADPRPRSFAKKIKIHADGSKTFKFGLKEFNSRGAPQKPIIKDASGQTDIPSSILIGNGSTAIVHVMAYESTKDGKYRSGIQLRGLQVLDLVEYSKNAEAVSLPPAEGFKLPIGGSVKTSADFF